MSGLWEDGHMRLRVILAGLGGLAAIGLYALMQADGMRDQAPGLFLLLFALLGCWSGVALALAGPLRPGRAMAGALILALPAAGLLRLAGQRHPVPTDVLDAPGTLSIFLLLIFVATPFLSVALQRRALSWSYAALFETAWAITIRFAAGVLFMAIVWGLLLLSHALLDIVGITVIGDLLDNGAVAAAVSGAALGLGIAAIHELREVVSPLLILRLLRLMIWPILVVVAVFLVAVPLQGLSGLVGGLSPAGTLMGVALGSVTLITAAVGRSDDEAMQAAMAPRLLALSVPLIAGLAAWAVGLRIAQYGLTPDRVLAGAVAGVMLAYGLVYGAAALRGGDWRDALRRGNVGLALLVMAVCAAWLSPLLNADALSARNQLARFADGRSRVDDLPLREMSQSWGRAGRDALVRMAEMADHPEQRELTRRLAELDDGLEVTEPLALVEPAEMARDLAGWVPQRPDGVLDQEALAGLARRWLHNFHWNCRPEDGAPPPCVFVTGRFTADLPAADQGLLIYSAPDGRSFAYHIRWPSGTADLLDGSAGLPSDATARILAGDYVLAPVETRVLEIDGLRLAPGLPLSK
ncbi:hypothetical protein [Marinibacterium sp. SX1]|uniref:hypothetical protein n=1 Tax=Marinibacterium sp. SX1 TaxID=3388424 RepID=UPI003D169182